MRISVLLVDDNPHGQIAREILLTQAGYLVSVASSGDGALQLLKALPVDILVTDYRMPGMDGLELIKTVRTEYPSVRIILLSGYCDVLGFTSAQSGADIVIQKGPGEVRLLIRSLRKLEAQGKVFRKPVVRERLLERRRRTRA